MQGMLRKLSSCQTTVTFEILVTLACCPWAGTHKLESRRGREDPKHPCMTRMTRKGVFFGMNPTRGLTSLGAPPHQSTRIQAGPGQSHRPP